MTHTPDTYPLGVQVCPKGETVEKSERMLRQVQNIVSRNAHVSDRIVVNDSVLYKYVNDRIVVNMCCQECDESILGL